MGKESLYSRALRNTGYYRIGMMTQDLIWEQYRYPIPLSGLLQGNSDQVVFEETLLLRFTRRRAPKSMS